LEAETPKIAEGKHRVDGGRAPGERKRRRRRRRVEEETDIIGDWRRRGWRVRSPNGSVVHEISTSTRESSSQIKSMSGG
jgi:hypothetical protein